ncbi:MAG: hypothetical protein WKG32_20810 [Gemmatimonadaceae bacterium]
MRESPSAGTLQRAFRADMLWGIAAALWMSTGLWRLFGQTEQPAPPAWEAHHELLVRDGDAELVTQRRVGMFR